MKAAPAVKSHARVSCIQREKPVSEVIVLQFTRGFGTGTLYLVYLYILDGLLAPLFSIFLCKPLKSMFFSRGEERMCVFFLCSRLPVAEIRRVSRLNLGADRTLANTLYAFTSDNGVFMSLCETQTYTIRSTPGKHSDADGDYT